MLAFMLDPFCVPLRILILFQGGRSTLMEIIYSLEQFSKERILSCYRIWERGVGVGVG